VRTSHALSLASALVLLCATRTFAAWPPGGIHLQRSDPVGLNGTLGLGPDGAGGTFVAWSEGDTVGVYAFRVHRLDVHGDPPAGWTAAGVRVSSSGGIAGTPQLAPDGGGGTYIVWARFDSTAWVDHLAADGSVAPGWPSEGLAVASPGKLLQVTATADGSGGVLVVWERVAPGSASEIYAQHILANGTRAASFPAAGRPLTGFAYQRGRFRPQLVRDANRGFWVSFHTVEIDPIFASSAYAVLHLEPSGLLTTGQPTNGLALSVPYEEIGTLAPYVPVALAPDGSGGVFAFTLGGNGNVRAGRSCSRA